MFSFQFMKSLQHHIEKTDSTNLLLKKIIDYKAQNNSQLPELFTIFADEQTSGRGLATNKWESEAGQNLLCSIYFRPPISPDRQFAFNQSFTLAVFKTVSQFVNNVKIKWPNDIYVNDRKIAGILIEHQIIGENIAHTVAGVGINVNQELFSENLPNPTSLKLITGKNHKIPDILDNLLKNCKFSYDKLISGKFDELNSEYAQYLYRINKISDYKIHGEIIAAKITGVNNYGQLLLEKTNGEFIACNLKEIVFL